MELGMVLGGRVARVCRVAVMGAVVLVGGGPVMHAQDSAASSQGSASLNTILDGMVSGLEKEMMDVANTMPADKYSFAPSQAIFLSSQKVDFDGVRTFAEQCTHVAQANYHYFGAVSGTKPSVDVEALKNLKSKAEVVQALQASFAFAHQAVATLTPENAMNPISGARMPATRATMVAGGVAHGFDHYGQMVEYLRMNGLRPSGSK